MNIDYNELISISVKILAAIVSIIITTLLPYLKAWLRSKLTEQQLSQIIKYVKLFVESAEQCLKDDDPTGEKRKQYVIEQLQQIGIQLTDEINAIIESQVLLLNQTKCK